MNVQLEHIREGPAVEEHKDTRAGEGVVQYLHSGGGRTVVCTCQNAMICRFSMDFLYIKYTSI